MRKWNEGASSIFNVIEIFCFCQDISNVKFPEVKKDEKTRKVLHGAIMDNDFMKNLEPGNEMIRLFYSWAIVIISTFVSILSYEIFHNIYDTILSNVNFHTPLIIFQDK